MIKVFGLFCLFAAGTLALGQRHVDCVALTAKFSGEGSAQLSKEQRYAALFTELQSELGEGWSSLSKDGTVHKRSDEILGRDIAGITIQNGKATLYNGTVKRVIVRYSDTPLARGPFYDVILEGEPGTANKRVTLWKSGDNAFILPEKTTQANLSGPETRTLPEILSTGGWTGFQQLVDKKGSVRYEDIAGKEIVGMVKGFNHTYLIRAKVLSEIPFTRFRELKNKPHAWTSSTGKHDFAIEVESFSGLIFPFPISAEEGEFYFRELSPDSPY